ncbi:ATPase [Qipengyuania sp. ASV99]|uniref:ATPase n=1 Tax=Qipengyuania sp. ASV99 TaxID=3399681 RepID=UPI003A4C5E0F
MPEAASKVEEQSLADAIEMDSELDLSPYDEEASDGAATQRFGWVVPTIAIALIAGWSALYGWAMQDRLLAAASAQPSEWTRWIIDWSVPVLLVGVGWLLTMRHSRAEAKRFAETASLLSRESSELETRLSVVNRELALAREFLGAQSLELESLGRIASERLSVRAAELQQLITDNGAQVDAIGSASETALSNMTRLRDDLPVVANSARDVSNQIGNAGRTAQDQLEKLVTGFDRLNQFGKASMNQIASFDTRVADVMTGFEKQLVDIGEVISSRLAAVEAAVGTYHKEISETESHALSALSERMSILQAEAHSIAEKLREAEAGAMAQLQASRSRFEADVTRTVQMLDQLDQQAISVSQKRVQELHEEAGRFDDRLAVRDAKFRDEIARRQEEFETRETQASEILAQRLADLDDALAERREEQIAQTEKLVAQSTAMTQQLEALQGLILEVSTNSDSAREGLVSGIGTLGEQLAQQRAALSETEERIAGLTDASIRLLEIIQSGAKHSREDLPKAIETASNTLGTVEQRAAGLSGAMFVAHQKAEGLGDYLIETQAKIELADNSIQSLQARLAEQSEEALARLQGLRGGFTRLTELSDSFAGEAQDRLREGLSALEQATAAAFAALEEGARERVGALAGAISKEAVSEIEKSLRNDTAETVGKLEQAAAHASGVGREATAQLRDQLAKVNELTINLEQRIARSRELAEEQVGNDFARRMALITDSLNSNAIDIASALSTDVTDTAWDAYLKGDRGIFTRRAVRLIDNSGAKEIADLYQRDDAFKSNVSRYIHDFEAMLRSMLSTRDGNALGVTILGSDMGKLYVVLAQAIERFRQ